MCVVAVNGEAAVAESETISFEWIEHLDSPDHEVWAVGDQRLVEGAGIPGDRDALAGYRERWGDPVDNVEEWRYSAPWGFRTAIEDGSVDTARPPSVEGEE